MIVAGKEEKMNFDVSQFPTREEAFQGLISRWNPVRKTEQVTLEDSLGRVLAEDMYAKNTLPVERSAACDTYAFKSQAFDNGMPDTSSWVEGVDFVRADMGDDFPDEFDTCTQVENVDRDNEGHFAFNERFKFRKGDCINKKGATVTEGTLLVRKNTKITPELLPVLATGGIRVVPVYKKLIVGFIPTGTELVQTGAIPVRGDTIECNGLMISAVMKEAGAECVRYPIIVDNRAMLEKMLDEALEYCDIVLINGGSSKGSEDFNKLILEVRGSYHTYGVKCGPGRPVGIALINDKPVINVPGPVLAAWLACDWLVRGLVYHYYCIPMPKRKVVPVKLTENMRGPGFMAFIGRVTITKTENGYEGTPVPREAGVLGMGIMQGQVYVPLGHKGYEAGTIVDCELLVGEELL